MNRRLFLAGLAGALAAPDALAQAVLPGLMSDGEHRSGGYRRAAG
jgi:hypothetical protein